MVYHVHLLKYPKDEDVYITLSSTDDFDSFCDVIKLLGYCILDWEICKNL